MGDRLPGGDRFGQGGAGERWSPTDRSVPDRHQDLANRFDSLQSNWGNAGWNHGSWTGPNGGNLNHTGFWGPNGYWGHTGYWGPNGGHWGHTGIYGPPGHWARPWGWYHGYGPAWGYGRWNYMWDRYPVAAAFGVTAWGINAVAWRMGVGTYYNPYYTTPVYVDSQPVVSYDQPVVGDPAYEQQAAAAADDQSAADPLTTGFDAARQSFFDGNYQDALNQTNQVLAQAPRDAALNEFRALCLFALGQYQDAAATIHAVLAAGPGWDWSTLISLYGDKDAYTTQLRALESAVRANPMAAETHFLLGYHYLTANHQDAAVKQWQRVVELQPKDTLSAQLVKMYTPEEGDSSAAETGPPPDLEEPAFPMMKLYGNWKATNSSGDFSLNLGQDDKFTWTFTRDNQPQSVSGVYIVRGDNLVMQPDSGGTMVGTIKLQNDNTLQYDPVGDVMKLTFRR